MIYPMVPFSVTLSDHGVIFRPIHALNVLCAQLTRDLFGIAKFLFSRSRSQVEPSHRFLRWMEQTTCFHLRMVSWETRTMSDVVWGNMPPKTPQKGEWIGSFKPKRQNLYIAICRIINPTNKLFEDRVQITKRTSWVARHNPKANTTWLTTAILKIDMTSYFRSGWSDLDEIWQSHAE